MCHCWITAAHLWVVFFLSLSHTQKGSLAAKGRNSREGVHHGHLTWYQTARGHFLTWQHVQDCFPNLSQSVRHKWMINEVCPHKKLQEEWKTLLQTLEDIATSKVNIVTQQCAQISDGRLLYCKKKKNRIFSYTIPLIKYNNTVQPSDWNLTLNVKWESNCTEISTHTLWREHRKDFIQISATIVLW